MTASCTTSPAAISTCIGGDGHVDLYALHDLPDAQAWQLRTRIRKTNDWVERSRLELRIARLTGANAVMWVDGPTKPAMDARKDLVRRSARALRLALQEGVVPGGGGALLACRD
jgi:chaperonin GroEL